MARSSATVTSRRTCATCSSALGFRRRRWSWRLPRTSCAATTQCWALKELRSLGVGVAFDDFGTGFAPLSRVKIDRGFVAGICTDPVDAAIVNARIHIANAMGIDVVGEGVETADQRDTLRACGCAVAQGWLFGRPMPLAELAARLDREGRLAA